MTDQELLDECKKGLNISLDSTDFNAMLTQKINIVKAYMIGAGVSDTAFTDESTQFLAMGIVILGVTDLWNLDSGVIRFSPVFNTLLIQLASG